MKKILLCYLLLCMPHIPPLLCETTSSEDCNDKDCNEVNCSCNDSCHCSDQCLCKNSPSFSHLKNCLSIFEENGAALDHAILSIYAVDTDTGQVLLNKNSSLSMTPASCMKIVSTGAALHILGPDYRFDTDLEYTGQIEEEGILNGHLYIRGGGDPCLGSDRITGNLSWSEQINAWADAVEKQGIRAIQGKVIGDASRWETAQAVPSWSWEDLGNYYGAGASALSFHENYYTLSLQPGVRVGTPAALLSLDPPLPQLALINEVQTGPKNSGDRACIFGSEFSTLQFIRGTIPAGVPSFTIKGMIPNPAEYTANALTQELFLRGISVEQKALEEKKLRTSFHTTHSPSLSEIVYLTNQHSINLYAEHLLKKIGEFVSCEGSTTAGTTAITNFWQSQGIDLNGFQMVDGSGLSRKNLITTQQLVEILLKMKASPYFDCFLDSLPQKNNSLRVKSGTMSLIKGYVGYANNIAFALLINQCPFSPIVTEKVESFLQILSNKDSIRQDLVHQKTTKCCES